MEEKKKTFPDEWRDSLLVEFNYKGCLQAERKGYQRVNQACKKE